MFMKYENVDSISLSKQTEGKQVELASASCYTNINNDKTINDEHEVLIWD